MKLKNVFCLVFIISSSRCADQGLKAPKIFFPIEVWKNINKNADKKTKTALKNALARHDINLELYKDNLEKNAGNILRQNIAQGNFHENEFDHKDYEFLLTPNIRNQLNADYNKSRIRFLL